MAKEEKDSAMNTSDGGDSLFVKQSLCETWDDLFSEELSEEDFWNVIKADNLV